MFMAGSSPTSTEGVIMPIGGGVLPVLVNVVFIIIMIVWLT